MSLLPVLGSQKTDRVYVEAKTLCWAILAVASIATSGLFMQDAFASTNSTWASDSTWASPDSSRAPRTNVSASERLSKPFNLSPFAPGSSNISLEMGQVFLMGNLGNNVSDSIGMGVHYTYGVSDLFGFESSMGYSSHTDGKMSMFNFQTGLRTNLAWYDKVIPYVSLGLGFYRPSYDLAQLGASSQPNSSLSPLLFGVHLGPGVDLEVTKQLFFGASLTFNDVFGSSETTPEGKPFDVGGTYTTFFLHAGVTF